MTKLAKVSALLALVAATGCANPADDVTPAQVSAPKPEAPAPTPEAAQPEGVAALAPIPAATAGAEAAALPFAKEASKIEFTGSKITGKHDGGFRAFDGTIALAPGTPEVAKVEAEIAMDSIWSDNEKLTGHLKNADFFDVPKYPTSKFVSTAIAPGGEKGASHTVTGNLTLHGVTKSIAFPATIKVTDEAATLDSEFFLRRKDFGIVYNGMANNAINDEVVIRLAIRAPRSAAK